MANLKQMRVQGFLKQATEEQEGDEEEEDEEKVGEEEQA